MIFDSAPGDVEHLGNLFCIFTLETCQGIDLSPLLGKSGDFVKLCHLKIPGHNLFFSMIVTDIHSIICIGNDFLLQIVMAEIVAQ